MKEHSVMTGGSKARTGRPQFTGITTYEDPTGRFAFRHPWGWHRSELDGRDGVIVHPEEADQETYFAVAVAELEVSVVADDLPALREGFEAGLAEFADLEIESADDQNYNDIVKIERTFTFTEDGQRRKRRVWALHADKWQFLVAYQGSTVEEFQYWLPMGNYCFTGFTLPQALWYATDPELRGGPPEDTSSS